MIDLEKLKTGMKVKYGFYWIVTFMGFDGAYAVLEDKHGFEKRVFMDLFIENGSIIEEAK